MILDAAERRWLGEVLVKLERRLDRELGLARCFARTWSGHAEMGASATRRVERLELELELARLVRGKVG